METDPAKHPPSEKYPISQVYKNYTKNIKNHYDVCFVVFSEKSADKIREIMAHYNIGRELYQIVTVSPKTDLPIQDTAINTHEEKIIRTLDDISGGTARTIIQASKLNPIEAISAINSLEKKGVLERSGTGTANSKPVWVKRQDLTQPESQRGQSEYSDTDSGQLLLIINDDPYNVAAKEELYKRGYTIKKKPAGGFSISKK